MKKTAAPSPEDDGDLIARLDRIIELLERQQAPYYSPVYPRPYVPYYPYWSVPYWNPVISGSTPPNTTTYTTYNTNGVTP